MNSVSWFIYIAGVVDGLTPYLIGVTICLAILLIATSIPAMISKFDKDLGTGVFFAIWSPLAKKVFPLLFLLPLIAVFLPSKTTLYAIAASEIGGQIISSPEAQEAMNDTKQILRDYLNSLKGEKK